ncbi:hypothetical protein WJX84_011409 [Apatococcus fuscideae]|uniref:Uncharacterized protein n=1 Tax=Apatococcus fuscideae TaxID=2026836 RepID=A0AAW1TJL8_9CHLO
MSDTVQKIVEAGTARAEEKLNPDSSTRSNPGAMADKVLKEGAKATRSQASKGGDAETANLAQAASDSRPGDGSAGAELASQVRSAVQEQTGSQHKDLADSAIEAASAALDRKPLDKQTAVADQGQLGTATEVLKAAESELVTKEVAEQGGVVRGGTAAKVQSAADKVKLDKSGKEFGIVKEIEAKLQAKQ